jgi:hypothetical protein
MSPLGWVAALVCVRDEYRNLYPSAKKSADKKKAKGKAGKND